MFSCVGFGTLASDFACYVDILDFGSGSVSNWNPLLFRGANAAV